MVDFQIKQNKIAFVDSGDNTIYTLPDSAGTAGNALVTDGSGKLFFGGIDIDSVLAVGDSSNRDMTVGVINAKTIEADTVVEGSALFSFQGLFSGYTAGGVAPPNPTSFSNPQGINGHRTIDKFPFASDANATDAGNLIAGTSGSSGQSSISHGYTSGGSVPVYSEGVIYKFPFSNNAGSSSVGILAGLHPLETNTGKRRGMGHSSADTGYHSGGSYGPGITGRIVKFPFAHDTNSGIGGNLTSFGRERGAGLSSATDGYAAGGLSPPGPSRTTKIDKFPFSTDANATTIGNLTVAKTDVTGQSSTTHGYVSGGNEAPPFNDTITTIEKFPFASDADATDIANLSASRAFSAGQSSISHGYTSGGHSESLTSYTNIIDKFPFSSDANATDVGDISKHRSESTGHQS